MANQTGILVAGAAVIALLYFAVRSPTAAATGDEPGEAGPLAGGLSGIEGTYDPRTPTSEPDGTRDITPPDSGPDPEGPSPLDAAYLAIGAGELALTGGLLYKSLAAPKLPQDPPRGPPGARVDTPESARSPVDPPRTPSGPGAPAGAPVRDVPKAVGDAPEKPTMPTAPATKPSTADVDAARARSNAESLRRVFGTPAKSLDLETKATGVKPVVPESPAGDSVKVEARSGTQRGPRGGADVAIKGAGATLLAVDVITSVDAFQESQALGDKPAQSLGLAVGFLPRDEVVAIQERHGTGLKGTTVLAVRQAGGVVEGAAQVIAHPVQTTQELGRATVRVGEGLGGKALGQRLGNVIANRIGLPSTVAVRKNATKEEQEAETQRILSGPRGLSAEEKATLNAPREARKPTRDPNPPPRTSRFR